MERSGIYIYTVAVNYSQFSYFAIYSATCVALKYVTNNRRLSRVFHCDQGPKAQEDYIIVVVLVLHVMQSCFRNKRQNIFFTLILVFCSG